SPCPHPYRGAFDYYAASALPPVRWHFRAPPKWGHRAWSSPVPPQELRGSRRCLLDAERYREQRGLEGGQPTHRYPLWGQVAQPVSPVRSYDVFPQVPRVTLGPRAGRSSASG